jgi:hypothetical protein
MKNVLVGFPLLEAMALVKRLDDKGGMSAAECDAAQRAHQRLVTVLAGEADALPSGVETIATSLVGEQVRVKTSHGRVFQGQLEKITGFRSIVIKDHPFSHPVNLSLVKSIEPVRSEVAA